MRLSAVAGGAARRWVSGRCGDAVPPSAPKGRAVRVRVLRWSADHSEPPRCSARPAARPAAVWSRCWNAFRHGHAWWVPSTTTTRSLGIDRGVHSCRLVGREALPGGVLRPEVAHLRRHVTVLIAGRWQRRVRLLALVVDVTGQQHLSPLRCLTPLGRRPRPAATRTLSATRSHQRSAAAPARSKSNDPCVGAYRALGGLRCAPR